MTQVTIYHNPRCSKSRSTMQILQDQAVEITEVLYLETPPTKEKLAQLCQMMDTKPLEIIRTGESVFKELGLSKSDSRSDDEWLDLMVNNPILIERPIVEVGNKAVIGRPPENVLSII